jgi:predicted protein tyrosine phosphatase|tara:strand:+ start:3456 stop:3962 length:507 start_codon:yes stop_codon:yes gene_type:complete
MIYVTSLLEMPSYARSLRPGYLVSIIQPEFQPETPPEIETAKHHRVEVHDISQPEPGAIHVQDEHILNLIEFLHAWPAEESLLVHCYAGISRSTAVALIALTMKRPGRESDAAQALREAAPHASPNRLIISLADRLLGLEGRLVAAREAIGAGTQAQEGPLVELSVND